MKLCPHCGEELQKLKGKHKVAVQLSPSEKRLQKAIMKLIPSTQKTETKKE